MAQVYADRVQQLTTTTGTGTVTLGSTPATFQSFAAIGNGNTCEYLILSGDGASWEVGIGTYTASGTTLSRTTVYDGSSGPGVLISLTGTSSVRVDAPAHRIMRGGLYQPAMSVVPTSSGTGLTTWVNQNGASVTDSLAGVSISAPAATAAGLHCRTMAVSGSYTHTALVALSGVAVNYIACGIGWYDGTAKFQVLKLGYNNGWVITVDEWSSATAFVTSNFSGVGRGDAGGASPLWLQLVSNSTNVFFNISHDGINFATLYTVAMSAGYLGSSGYSNVVFYLNPQGTTTTVAATLMAWT